MLKHAVPIVLFIAAGVVWHYNDTHAGSFMLLPFLDVIPPLRGNVPAQAEWSWRILAGLGVLVLLVNLAAGRKRSEEQDGGAPT